MLKAGKLYRHRMVRLMPDQPIKACVVKRSASNPTGWVGGINTIDNIKDYAGGMMLVEYYFNAEDPAAISAAAQLAAAMLLAGAGQPHNLWGIFLAGDRFVMLDTEFVEPV